MLQMMEMDKAQAALFLWLQWENHSAVTQQLQTSSVLLRRSASTQSFSESNVSHPC